MKRLVKDLHLGDNVQSHDGQWHTITAISPFWNQRKFSIVEFDNVIVKVYNHSMKILVRELSLAE
jgi:hypothetical protein